VQRSTERILTTHVGSLPVPPDLDPAAPDYETRLRATVAELVRKQAAIGIDVVSDGAASKGNWLVYAAGRLGGFEPRRVDASEAIIAEGKDRAELAEFYEEATRTGTRFHSSWRQVARRTWTTHGVATGPITDTGQAAVQRAIANLQAALAPGRVVEALLPATAPASLEPYRSNAYHPSETAFLYALAGVLKEEYMAIARAGLLVQIDDAWTVALWDRIGIPMGLEAFKRRALQRAEVLNHALADIPEEQVRYHSYWGSWYSPHAYALPMAEAVDLLLAVKAGAYSVRGGQRAPRARVPRLGARATARGQDPDPRRGDALHQPDRAPGAGLRADPALRPVGRPRERDRRHGLRVRWTHPPAARLGEARGAGRGRAARHPRPRLPVAARSAAAGDADLVRGR
jgi:5-methyltetrahydropteroyltriglutamate--homocysteine methyltransferase